MPSMDLLSSFTSSSALSPNILYEICVKFRSCTKNFRERIVSPRSPPCQLFLLVPRVSAANVRDFLLEVHRWRGYWSVEEVSKSIPWKGGSVDCGKMSEGIKQRIRASKRTSADHPNELKESRDRSKSKQQKRCV